MEENRGKPTSIGYYFIMFQSTLDHYVKCWFDGNEYYDFMLFDDFLDLFLKAGSSHKTYLEAADALSTTSIYLWDISSDSIRPLHNSNYDEGSIGDDLNKTFQNYKKSLDNPERVLYRFS